jgi:hypothetical protein
VFQEGIFNHRPLPFVIEPHFGEDMFQIDDGMDRSFSGM